MGPHLERAEPDKRKGRATLTARPSFNIENALQATNFDKETIQQAAVWGNALLRSRDVWAAKNRSGKRYSDVPADRQQNSLGGQNRGRAR